LGKYPKAAGRARRRTALAGDNSFSAKAYLRAADSLAALVEPLDRIVLENRLRELPGIGETIADIVAKLRRGIPEGVLDMLSIPGLKSDKIRILHKELGIADVAALEVAAREDRLKPAKGLSARCSARSSRACRFASMGSAHATCTEPTNWPPRQPRHWPTAMCRVGWCWQV
jgi:DNA polymerase (family 10)